MPFCMNCGQKLTEGARFCAGCGSPVGTANNTTQRKQEWAGSIIKCPNCNDNIPSFTTTCPSCGLELRNTKASNSVREFAIKLEEIEKTRPSKSFSFKRRIEEQTEISSTDMKKISLIKSFAIPNTKEDILEFLVLASSNINMQRYNDFEFLSESEKAVSDAWEAKFEQAYEKAKLSFGNTSEFSKIQAIYDKKSKQLNISKKKHKHPWLETIIFFISVFSLLGIIAFILFSCDNNSIEKENNRLNIIVEEVYEYIDEENYNLARAKAATLVFSGSTTKAGDQTAEKWDKTREELIEIINKAEYGSDYINSDINEQNETSLSETKENYENNDGVSGFVDGIENGISGFENKINEFENFLNDLGQ